MKKLQSHSAPPAPVLCNSLGQNFHQLQLSSELQLGTPLICWVFNDASVNAPGNNESDLQAVRVLPDRRSLLLPAQAKPQSHFIPCDFSLHVAGSRFLTQAEMSYVHKTWRTALGSVPWWIKWSSNRWDDHDWAAPWSGRLPGSLWCLQKGCEASRLPSLGSISRLIYGAAVGTIWFLRFARPRSGFYSNHLLSIIEWWTASLSGYQTLPMTDSPGTNSAVDANWATALQSKISQKQKWQQIFIPMVWG